ncbi:MAG: SDR family oxidoreductase [Patescibacteria group bacterium]
MSNNFYTLITGASGGIGLALAREFASHGNNVLLVARSREKLENTCRELHEVYGVQADFICFDLSQINNFNQLYQEIESKNYHFETLVNNAGFGLNGEFINLDLAKQTEMINLNVSGLVNLSHYFANKFKAQGFGKIMNIGSTVSFMYTPYMSVYNGTKWFVRAFSVSLNEELQGTGVKVICFCPGATTSDFASVAGIDKIAGFTTQPKQTPEQVAKLGYKALVNDHELEISGWINNLQILVIRLLPRRLAVNISGKLLKN